MICCVSVFAAVGMLRSGFADQDIQLPVFEVFPDFVKQDHSEANINPKAPPVIVSEPEKTPVIHEVTILQVTSDARPGTDTLNLQLDEEETIVALRKFSLDGKGSTHPFAELQPGAVLLKAEGRVILKLVNVNATQKDGGEIKLMYLSNGIWNSYGEFNMELVHEGKNWGLQVNEPSGRRAFTKMILKKKVFLGQVIGIGEIEVQ